MTHVCPTTQPSTQPLAGRRVIVTREQPGELADLLTARGAEVLHVPLVIRFPFELQPRRIRTQVRNLDIAPTILDLAGVAAPKSFEGSSLLPLIEAVEDEDDRVAFSALGAPMGLHL